MTFRSPDDPYRDQKKYHRASKINQKGGVSALCFKSPRAIDLTIALWTNRDGAVTCEKCLRIMQRAAPAPSPTESPSETEA